MTAFASILLSVLFVLGFWFAGGWFLRERDPVEQVWSSTLPFLGGPVPSVHAWSRFHFRFYPMVLLFIAFEMEMMFMYPWAVVFVKEGVKAFAEMGMFLGILSLGVLYAWREGALRWQ